MVRTSKPNLGSPTMLLGRNDTGLETSQVSSRELSGVEWVRMIIRKKSLPERK